MNINTSNLLLNFIYWIYVSIQLSLALSVAWRRFSLLLHQLYHLMSSFFHRYNIAVASHSVSIHVDLKHYYDLNQRSCLNSKKTKMKRWHLSLIELSRVFWEISDFELNMSRSSFSLYQSLSQISYQYSLKNFLKQCLDVTNVI